MVDPTDSDNRTEPPPTPLWVKVSSIVVLVLGLLFIIMHLLGRGLGNH